MYIVPEEILSKHQAAIEAARKYWVLSEPTGLTDLEFDQLESLARADGLELRDYVCQEIQGERSENAGYIKAFPKEHVHGSMLEAIREYSARNPQVAWWVPKYDGSSLAAYYDPKTGRLVKVVTVGGSNLGSTGIDQTEKFGKFFPDTSGTGVIAIQAECLVPLEHGFGETSRQKANGLVNAAWQPRGNDSSPGYLKKFRINQAEVQVELDRYISIRAFRIYSLTEYDYRAAMWGLPILSPDPTLPPKFAGAATYSLPELEALGTEVVDNYIWSTSTGTFLVDGLVAYDAKGNALGALKYGGAGLTELSEVQGIKWNNQRDKGKDSWSANAVISAISIRGSQITKPSVGSIKKMITEGISKGAKVKIGLAGSTIPAITEVIVPGNLDFEWPTCPCGHLLGPSDIYGALVKCGNPGCTDRLDRMTKYLAKCQSIEDIDIDRLLVIDRVKLKEKVPAEVIQSCIASGNFSGIYNYLTTPLQVKNLDLVRGAAEKAVYEWKNNRKP